MLNPSVRVANGLLLFGQQLEEWTVGRDRLFAAVGVPYTSFRSSASELGARAAKPGARFFDTAKRGRIRFGPGAGLALAVQVGTDDLLTALIDANGTVHHARFEESVPNQYDMEPSVLLKRIRRAAESLVSEALFDDDLLAEGSLPLLGVVVVVDKPLDTDAKPAGPAWGHPSWRSGKSLRQRLAQSFGLPVDRCYAIRSAQASALGVAWRHTRSSEYLDQRNVDVAMVLNLSSSTSAATVIVDPSTSPLSGERVTGFLSAQLIVGQHHQAGEIGHIGVDRSVLAELNKRRPADLPTLRPYRCSCTDQSDPTPPHLEAFVSTGAVTTRLGVSPSSTELARLVRRPREPQTARALSDLGALLGATLVGPLVMVDPGSITLTGPLATAEVSGALSGMVARAGLPGGEPDVRIVEDPFIALQGAGLAMLRERVFRRLDAILDGPRLESFERVRGLGMSVIRPELDTWRVTHPAPV